MSEAGLGGECWVLTTGEAGMRSQVIGLAEATGVPFVEKTIRLRAPWSMLPGHLCPAPLLGLGPESDPIAPPWPRLLIGCGRRSTAVSIAIRRLSGGRTRTVHVQNPLTPPRYFDLVVPMRHDGLSGPNVVPIDTALHRVRPAVLARAGAEWRERLRGDAPAATGFVLGGPNRHYRMSGRVIAGLLALVREARAHTSGRVLVTPSRRTEPAAIEALRDAFGGETWFHLWDGTGENPYFGILAISDRLVVTGDSVSMVSEALATGHPVHVLRLEGHGRRHELFLDTLRAGGAVSLVEDGGLDWGFAGRGRIDATPEIAARVAALLG